MGILSVDRQASKWVHHQVLCLKTLFRLLVLVTAANSDIGLVSHKNRRGQKLVLLVCRQLFSSGVTTYTVNVPAYQNQCSKNTSKVLLSLTTDRPRAAMVLLWLSCMLGLQASSARRLTCQ